MTPRFDPGELTHDELRDIWALLSRDERLEAFGLLRRDAAANFFVGLDPRTQAEIVEASTPGEQRLWLRLLEPDDAADVVQATAAERRDDVLLLLDATTLREVSALLAYAEDHAGGLMSPRFARVRPEMRVDEAIRYLQRQARGHLETFHYVYALDAHRVLCGVVSFRELFAAPADARVRDVMHGDVRTVRDDLDQEAVAEVFRRTGFLVLPVVDREGRMQGIVTLDDIVHVVEEEATRDAQKFGGLEALDVPYLEAGFGPMIRKRAGWLAALFFGEMLTASAMSHYETEIARAVVLALFVPLIISSGGNSGSQAATLVIRAMALGEVRLRDWFRIMRRELVVGLALGIILGAIGLVRILAWQSAFHTYGAHAMRVAITVAISLVGVVLWGTASGSMLPFLIRRLGFDPASASAPFVATLVDVSGLIIYFSVASVVLGGVLL
jgi:magnesium transporter